MSSLPHSSQIVGQATTIDAIKQEAGRHAKLRKLIARTSMEESKLNTQEEVQPVSKRSWLVARSPQPVGDVEVETAVKIFVRHAVDFAGGDDVLNTAHKHGSARRS